MKTTEERLKEKGLAFKIVNDPQEMEEIYRLRYEIFCEEMRVCDKKDFPDKKESDEYDNRSAHFIITHQQNEIVAYSRLILPPKPLPIYKYNCLPDHLFDNKTAAEVSRGFVAQKWRNSNIIWLGWAGVYKYCQQNNIKSLLSFSNLMMYKGLKKRNISLHYVGKPITFQGYETYPFIIEVKQGKMPNFY